MENRKIFHSTDDILTHIHTILPSLAKRMRQCGEYMSENHDQIAFSTVAEISQKAGVQPSAMMRFCQQLGFTGYSEMQQIFRKEMSKPAPDYATRLANLRSNGKLNPATLLAEFVDAGRYSLEKLLCETQEAHLHEAVKILNEAKLIHIVGYQRAFPVANCLSYALEKLKIANICHDDVGKISRFNALSQGDGVIAITFSPYTAGTVEMIETALQKGLKVVVITDSDISPANIEGVCLLKAIDIDVGDFRSLSASINLAMTLAVSLGSLREA